MVPSATITRTLHILWLRILLGLAPSAARAQTEGPADETPPAAQEEQPNAETLLDHAPAAFEAGAYEKVIDLATRWLQQEPDSADGYYLRGEARAEGPKD